MRHASLTALRRLAISCQHLDAAPRPSMLEVIRALGCLQLDPIAVVDHSHHLVLWSRLGAYDRGDLDRLLWKDRSLFEYWAHAASIVLTEEYPVHAWRMQRMAATAPWYADVKGHDLTPLAEAVQAHLRAHGPSRSKDIGDIADGPHLDHAWFGGRWVPRILEELWSRGEVLVAGRDRKQRLWAMPEAVLPEWTPRDEWDDRAVTRFSVAKAVRALGAATAPQIRAHYTRKRYPQLADVLYEMVADHTLAVVAITDESEKTLPGTWYVHRDDLARLDAIEAGEWEGRTTLLSPFDNLICDRARTEMVWNFRFRLEIYVPAAKREFGYYVMPILDGDRLVGRASLRVDRARGVLVSEAIYAEPGVSGDGGLVGRVRSALESLAAAVGVQGLEWGVIPPGWEKIRS